MVYVLGLIHVSHFQHYGGGGGYGGGYDDEGHGGGHHGDYGGGHKGHVKALGYYYCKKVLGSWKFTCTLNCSLNICFEGRLCGSGCYFS